MQDSERVAAAIVQTVIPGARMTYRASQANGEWDFDLVLSSGMQAALDVTSSADAVYLRLSAAIVDERKGGPFVKAEKCKLGWWIHAEEDANIRRIRKHVDTYLSSIEAAGLKEFSAYQHAYSHPAVAQIVSDLRIDSGSVVKWKTPQTIGIGFPARGGLVDPDCINAVLLTEASKSDNIRKLAQSGRGERHLFVYIDSSSYQAWQPMLRGMLPSRASTLPESITHAWVASSVAIKDTYRVIRLEHGSDWHDCGFVRIASDAGGGASI